MIGQNQIFSFGNHTDTGLVRKQNEDYFGYFDTVAGHLFVVTDGMGGHAGGALAAQMAVGQMHEYINHPAHISISMNELLANAIEFANNKILDFSDANPEYYGMGTTVVAMMVRDNKACIGHLGDSRAYVWDSGNLIKLTQDHSYVQHLINQKVIDEQQAHIHPKRNQLLQALGTSRNVAPDITLEFDCRPGQAYLLVTDGVWGLVEDEQLADTLNKLPTKMNCIDAAVHLVEMANAAGGADNSTVQIVFFNLKNIEQFQEIVSEKTEKTVKTVKETLIAKKPTYAIVSYKTNILLYGLIIFFILILAGLFWYGNNRQIAPDKSKEDIIIPTN